MARVDPTLGTITLAELEKMPDVRRSQPGPREQEAGGVSVELGGAADVEVTANPSF